MKRFALLFSGVALLARAVAQQASVPVYCRLLEVGLHEAQFQPVLEDLMLTAQVQAPLLGEIDVTATRAEVGAVKVVNCVASVDERGTFNVSITQLDVSLEQLTWLYMQNRWPHISDNGIASANVSVSFNVAIDMVRDVREVFDLQVDALDLKLGAAKHTWFSGAIETLTKFPRSLVTQVVQLVAKKALDDNLKVVHDKGGCAFMENALEALDMVHFQFISYEPLSTHVPVLGNVSISVNSTSITPPTSLSCQHVLFNGTTMTAHLEDLAFGAGFNWAYQKVGSSFWHNQGSALTNVVAGTLLHIDLMRPTDTRIQLDLPTLELQLHADADNWMYQALTDVMVPLVRRSLQVFGGKVLSHYVAKCLADPSCPHLAKEPWQNTSTSAPSNIMVI